MFTTNKEATMKIILQNVVHYVSTCNPKQMNIFPLVWYQYSLGFMRKVLHYCALLNERLAEVHVQAFDLSPLRSRSPTHRGPIADPPRSAVVH